jgi:hypothetical protein
MSTPVHPARVATALGDGGEAGELLDFGRALRALARLAEGRQQPWGVHGSRARQGTEPCVVRPCGRMWRDLQVEALEGLEHDASLWG